MSVEVVVPWLGGCPHRERALEWVRRRVQYPHHVAPGSEPWVKARAIGPVIEAIDAEIVVVHDADVFCPGLPAAVEAIHQGATWGRPHSSVHRLTEAATAAVLGGAPWRHQELEQRSYAGLWGGGIVVARREALIKVPMDPRFVGWGQEDASWGMALHHLLGPGWSGTDVLLHLWHPPQARETRKYGSLQGKALWRRYVQARRDPKLMRALIEEAHVALTTPEPNVLDRPAL